MMDKVQKHNSFKMYPCSTGMCWQDGIMWRWKPFDYKACCWVCFVWGNIYSICVT